MEEQNIPKTKNKRKIIVLIILLLLVVLMVIAIVSYTNYEKEKVKRNQPTPHTTKEE